MDIVGVYIHIIYVGPNRPISLGLGLYTSTMWVAVNGRILGGGEGEIGPSILACNTHWGMNTDTFTARPLKVGCFRNSEPNLDHHNILLDDGGGIGSRGMSWISEKGWWSREKY